MGSELKLGSLYPAPISPSATATATATTADYAHIVGIGATCALQVLASLHLVKVARRQTSSMRLPLQAVFSCYYGMCT